VTQETPGDLSFIYRQRVAKYANNVRVITTISLRRLDKTTLCESNGINLSRDSSRDCDGLLFSVRFCAKHSDRFDIFLQ